MKKRIHRVASTIFWFTAVIYGITLAAVSYVGVYLTYVAVPTLVISGCIAWWTREAPSTEISAATNTHSAEITLVAGPAKIKAEGRVISNFALQHLKAACIFRDRVIEYEAAHRGEELAAFFEDIRSYASACVMSATSSLEALINEFYLNHHGTLRAKIANFEVEFWGNGGIERRPILKKYQTALSLLGFPRMHEDADYFKDAEALIGMRNYLVHFRPAWDAHADREAELIRYMKTRYKLSPFVGETADFLTMRSMSAGCAVWATNTALRFMREFDAVARLDEGKMSGFWKLEVSTK